MKTLRYVVPAAVVAFAGLADRAQAQTQTVAFQVAAINQMSVSASPATLTINSAVAGSAPVDATDASTTWAITTNQTGTKVTAAIDQAMPSGVTLKVNLAAPSNASSAPVELGTTSADVVTGITKLNASGLGITYTLSATAAAGVIANASRTVTYTVVAGT